MGTLTLTGGNFLTIAGDGVSSFGSLAGTGVLGYASIGNRNISLTGNYTFNGTSGNSGQNITFNGTGNQILLGVISTGTAGTGVVTINKTSGQVLLGGNMVLNNQGLTVTSGVFNPNGYLLTTSILNIGASGTLLVDAATFAVNYSVTTLNAPAAGSTITYTNNNPAINAAVTYQNLVFSGSGTAVASAAVTIQGNLSTTGSGSFNFGANDVTISGTVASNNVTGFTTTGSVSFTKTSGTTTLTGNISTDSLTMNGNGGTLNLGSSLTHSVTYITMTRGTLNGGSSLLNVSGSWSGTGAIFSGGAGTVGYVSSSAQSISVTPTYYNLTIAGASIKTIPSSPLNISNNLVLSSGSTLNATTTTNINIGGNWTNNGGTFTNTNTTVIFNGSAAQTIGGSQSTTFNSLTINNTNGNVALGIATSLNKLLTLTSGKLDATNYSLTLNSGASAVAGASASNYIITGNGTSGTGSLNINSLAANTARLFPVGTAAYYLPATLNPGAATGESFSAFVYTGVTTNGSANGPLFSSTALSNALNAVWNISRSAGSGNVTITLNWSSSGTALEGSSFQKAGLNIGISPYEGSWQTVSGNGSVSSQTASATVSSFSPFNVAANSTPLPVTLIDFSAVLNTNTIGLSWITTSEINASYFEIEKSNDGIDWNTIGTVKAKGNSSENINYSFDDASPKTGMNYYRLKITDIDGNFTYSSIENIAVSAVRSVQVFPNPASDFINISLSSAATETNIRLFNIAGQLLQTAKANNEVNTTIQMPVSNYKAGTYLLVITGTDGNMQTTKVVIAKE